MALFAPEGRRWRLYALCATLATLTNFLEGYSSSYPNTAGDSFRAFINGFYVRRGAALGLTEWGYTWFWSALLNVWFIGAIAGTFLTPYVTNHLGRQKSLLATNSVGLFAAMISTSAIRLSAPELLFVGRLLASVASGLSFSALILFLQETAPTRYRGTCSYFSEVSFLFTNVFGMVAGMNVILGQSLESLLGFALLLGIFCVLIVVPLEETPKHLLLHKRDLTAATNALHFYQGAHIDTESILDGIRKESVETRGGGVFDTISDAYRRPSLRKATLIGVAALQLCVVIWPLDYITTEILQVHFSVETAQATSVAFVSVNFLASVVGMQFVDYYGRRPMLLASAVVNTLSLVAYIAFDRLAVGGVAGARFGCIGALIVYALTYGAAVGPIPWFIVNELVPQEFRSLLLSVCIAFNMSMAFIFSFATWPMWRWIDVWAFVPLFILPSTAAIAYLYAHMPETRGREVYKIVNELAGITPPPRKDDTSQPRDIIKRSPTLSVAKVSPRDENAAAAIRLTSLASSIANAEGASNKQAQE